MEVSIHAPTRGATPDECFTLCGYGRFQSTHPHGVRRARPGRMPQKGQRFQSTHPHGVRLPDAFGGIGIKCVSIHAPTRGATAQELAMKVLTEGVSIHAPTRGATNPYPADGPQGAGFQSTHPHGVRQCAKLHIISQ